MNNIKYISLESACEIHKMTIAHSGGGAIEHFDLGRLESVLQNIQNLQESATLTARDHTLHKQLHNRRFCI